MKGRQGCPNSSHSSLIHNNQRLSETATCVHVDSDFNRLHVHVHVHVHVCVNSPFQCAIKTESNIKNLSSRMYT